MKNLLAIGFIWLGCAVAWVVLGSTLVVRTGDAGSSLFGEVQQLWGPPMQQAPPAATYQFKRLVKETLTANDAYGRPVSTVVEREVLEDRSIALDASAIQVELGLEHRRKGLLWFPTYDVAFEARYAFLNDSGERREVQVRFPLEQGSLVYDGFRVESGGKPVAFVIERGFAGWTAPFEPGERREYRVAYRSRGTKTWTYGAHGTGFTGAAGQARNFELTMRTRFQGIDFPAGTLSPTRHGEAGAGWEGTWRFESIVTGAPIGVELPQRLNPGPLASKITFFAPVGLLFFFFVVAILAAARGKHVHPMNYFLFGCAFFAFHLLFAYLVDHLAVYQAFAVSSAVSILLVVSYARLFVGWRFAVLEMGLSQLIYLVLFSFTFFWEGFTGLAITVGAVLTLFVIMQITGRLDWRASERAAAQPAVGP